MSGREFRESLNAYAPSVYVNGRKVKSVAGDADLAPGVNALGLTYDYALRRDRAPLMRALQHTSGEEVNRLIHVAGSSADLLNKLEAVRLVCQETGCAQRYLSGDAYSALYQSTHRTDAALGGDARDTQADQMNGRRLSLGMALAQLRFLRQNPAQALDGCGFS